MTVIEILSELFEEDMVDAMRPVIEKAAQAIDDLYKKEERYDLLEEIAELEAESRYHQSIEKLEMDNKITAVKNCYLAAKSILKKVQEHYVRPSDGQSYPQYLDYLINILGAEILRKELKDWRKVEGGGE